MNYASGDFPSYWQSFGGSSFPMDYTSGDFLSTIIPNNYASYHPKFNFPISLFEALKFGFLNKFRCLLLFPDNYGRFHAIDWQFTGDLKPGNS